MFHFRREVIRRGIEFYTEKVQCLKIAEELCELAANVIKRSFHPNNKKRPQVIKEIGDVLVCVENIREVYNITDEEVQQAIYQAQNQFSQHLDEEETKAHPINEFKYEAQAVFYKGYSTTWKPVEIIYAPKNGEILFDGSFYEEKSAFGMNEANWKTLLLSGQVRLKYPQGNSDIQSILVKRLERNPYYEAK